MRCCLVNLVASLEIASLKNAQADDDTLQVLVQEGIRLPLIIRLATELLLCQNCQWSPIMNLIELNLISLYYPKR